MEDIGGTDGETRSTRGSILASALTLTYRIIPWPRPAHLLENPIPYESLDVPFICPDVPTGEE